MTTWFTSDPHFGHKGIIELCGRPFAPRDVATMNEALIERWRATVAPTDTVWVVGDFSFATPAETREIFDRLPGRKHLVIGNHDEQNKRTTLALPWESQQHYVKVRESGHRFILCHYPMETWDGAYKGYFHLHGHCHGSLTVHCPRRMDVGVDALAKQGGLAFGSLISLDHVVRLLDVEDYKAVDHHGL